MSCRSEVDTEGLGIEQPRRARDVTLVGQLHGKPVVIVLEVSF